MMGEGFGDFYPTGIKFSVSGSSFCRFGSYLPGCARGVFVEVQRLVKVHCRVIFDSNMQPDFICVALAGVFNGRLSQPFGDALAPVCGIDGDIGDQETALALVPVRDQAEIACQVAIFFPYETAKWHGSVFGDSHSPAQVARIAGRAAHLTYIPAPILVQGFCKAGLDQVRDRV